MPESDTFRFLPPENSPARFIAILMLVTAPFAVGGLCLWLGQDANWDLRNYHWYNAYAFLKGRYGFDLFPSQTPYFYNPTLDVPFYLLATHTSARVAGFILGTVQGLNFIPLFMLTYLCLRLKTPGHKVAASAAVATLGLLGGGGIALLGTTFYDNVTSLGLFASLLLVIRYYDNLMEEDHGLAFALALLCGVPAGLMMGLKLPSVIFCVGLCGALLFVRGTFQRRVLISFGFGVGVLLGCAVTLGHWAAFLQTHFGNPLFPYFNQFFQSPLAPPTSARDIQYVTHNLSDFLFFPFVFAQHPMRVGEIPWRDWRLPLLYTLLPLAVCARFVMARMGRGLPKAQASTDAETYLLWAAAISYFVWLAMFCIYRYLIPLEMLAPLLIVVAVGFLPLGDRGRQATVLVMLLIVALSVQPGNWYRRMAWNDQFVGAVIPPLGDTSNLMILMAGFEPYSHLVTQFPPEIPFIRIQSNLASPDQNKGVNDILHQRVDAHKGRFMILIPPWQHELSAVALRFFHLQADWQACQTVVDRLYDDKSMDLCPVTRVKE